MDKKIANRKKGICEFFDITNPYSSNIDKNYANCIEKYPTIFRNYMGIFSNMYDAARKNGNLVIPFRKEKIELSSKKSAKSEITQSYTLNQLNTLNENSQSISSNNKNNRSKEKEKKGGKFKKDFSIKKLKTLPKK